MKYTKNVFKLIAAILAFNIMFIGKSFAMGATATCVAKVGFGAQFCTDLFTVGTFTETGGGSNPLVTELGDSTLSFKDQVKGIVDAINPGAVMDTAATEAIYELMKKNYTDITSGMIAYAFAKEFGLQGKTDVKIFGAADNPGYLDTSMMYAQNDKGSSAFDARTFFIGDKKVNSYLSYSFTSAEQEANDKVVAGFDMESTNISLGFDTEIEKDLMIGGSIAISQTEIDSNLNVANSQERDQYSINIVAVKKLSDQYFINAGVGYSYGDNSTTRTSTLVAPGAAAATNIITSNPDSQVYMASAGGGMVHKFNDFAVIPELNLNFSHHSIDTFDENGTGVTVNKNINIDDTQILEAEIAVSAMYKGFSSGNNKIVPRVRIAYGHDLIDDDSVTSLNFAGSTTKLTLTSSDGEAGVLTSSVGVDAYNTNGLNLRLSYINTMIGDFTAHTGVFNVGYQF